MARGAKRGSRISRADNAGEATTTKSKKPRGKSAEDVNTAEDKASGPSRKPAVSVSHSLYELLGVSKDASPREITAAYRRRALMCHPDKIRQRQKMESEGKKVKGENIKSKEKEKHTVEEATKHFQQLQAAYAVLSDPKKRERYDRTGETDDDALEGKSYEEAYAYYREKFPEVTEKAIDEFKARYINSEEEKEDIIDFISRFNGDLSKFFEYIPLSDPADSSRYKQLLTNLVKEKKIKETSSFKKTIKEFDSIAEKYKKKFAKEKSETGNKRKKDEDDTSALALAILGNMSKRQAASDRFLEELGKKYSSKKRRNN